MKELFISGKFLPGKPYESSSTFAKTGSKVSARYNYTYHWDGSRWLITSHNYSAMPEKQ